MIDANKLLTHDDVNAQVKGLETETDRIRAQIVSFPHSCSARQEDKRKLGSALGNVRARRCDNAPLAMRTLSARTRWHLLKLSAPAVPFRTSCFLQPREECFRNSLAFCWKCSTHDDYPRDRGLSEKLGEAEKGSSRVVVHVKESEGLLLQDEEDSVTELPELEEVVEDVQGLHAGSPGLGGADGGKEAPLVPDGHNLLEHAGEEKCAGEREGEVVNDKRPLELHRRHAEAAHELAAREDEGEVAGHGDEHAGHGAEGCVTGLP